MKSNGAKLTRLLAVIGMVLVATSIMILYPHVSDDLVIVLCLTISALVGGYFWYPTMNMWAWKRHGENRPKLFAKAVEDWAEAIGLESVSRIEFRIKGRRVED